MPIQWFKDNLAFSAILIFVGQTFFIWLSGRVLDSAIVDETTRDIVLAVSWFVILIGGFGTLVAWAWRHPAIAPSVAAQPAITPPPAQAAQATEPTVSEPTVPVSLLRRAILKPREHCNVLWRPILERDAVRIIGPLCPVDEEGLRYKPSAGLKIAPPRTFLPEPQKPVPSPE